MTKSLLSARGVVRRIGDRVVLGGVDLDVARDELVVIVGPNGAGKTTLLEALAGLHEVDAGTIALDGVVVTPATYPRDRVGVVLQREAFVDGMTVGDYADLFAAIFGLPGGAATILAAAQLTARATQPVTKLSGGEAQRLVLAAVLAPSPGLLLLDEPTAALDPSSKQAMGEAIRAAVHDRGVVLCTHDLAEAERLATRVVFLVEGRVRASGAVATILAEATARTLAQAFFTITERSLLAGEAV